MDIAALALATSHALHYLGLALRLLVSFLCCVHSELHAWRAWAIARAAQSPKQRPGLVPAQVRARMRVTLQAQDQALVLMPVPVPVPVLVQARESIRAVRHGWSSPTSTRQSWAMTALWCG